MVRSEGSCDREVVKVNHHYFSDVYRPQKAIKNAKAVRRERPILMIIPEFSNNMPSPCSYLRLLNPLYKSSLQDEFEIRFGSIDTAQALRPDVIILNRVPSIDIVDLIEFIRFLKENGIKLIYDIDDYLLQLPESHPEVHVYKPKQAIVLRLLAEADLVWTSTSKLQQELQPLCRDVQVFENYLEPELLANKTTHRYVESRKSSARFQILYMGTSTHSADLSLVMSALDKLHQEGFSFTLNLIGITDSPPDFPWIHSIPVDEKSSYPLFIDWLRRLGKFDLGIAPLQENSFNECKSAIKFWDYSSLGIATLASNMGSYANLIHDSIDGYLADNTTASWYSKFKEVFEKADRLESIVENAQNSLKNFYRLLDGTATRTISIRRLLADSSIENQPLNNGNFAQNISREIVADGFLNGNGIEIGALHSPLSLPPNAKVKFVDRMSKASLYEHYPELRSHNLVEVDVIDDGEYLSTFPDNSQDFVVANHFIEHSEDPIVTISNLLRVTKVHGVIYLAIPDMKKTFDRNRQQTTLAHLLDDHRLGVKTSRRSHYEEWVGLVEPHFGRSYDKPSFDRRVEELLGMHYSVHFHCWEDAGFLEFLRFLQSEFKLKFRISLFVTGRDEIITVLTKTS